ncbi:hypothetical protein D3C76_1363640 [compost metagenome]
MARLQALLTVGDQQGEAGAEYLLLHFLQVVDGEGFWRVHGNFPLANACILGRILVWCKSHLCAIS